jgi:hypothetical protein
MHDLHAQRWHLSLGTFRFSPWVSLHKVTKFTTLPQGQSGIPVTIDPFTTSEALPMPHDCCALLRKIPPPPLNIISSLEIVKGGSRWAVGMGQHLAMGRCPSRVQVRGMGNGHCLTARPARRIMVMGNISTCPGPPPPFPATIPLTPTP